MPPGQKRSPASLAARCGDRTKPSRGFLAVLPFPLGWQELRQPPWTHEDSRATRQMEPGLPTPESCRGSLDHVHSFFSQKRRDG